MKKYRGSYRVTREMLTRRLGISPWIYKVEINDGGDIVFHCYAAQDAVVVRPSEVPLMVTLEDPRFF